MSKRLIVVLAAALAAALPAAGCGSGGGDPSVAKAEFARRADAICTQSLAKSAQAVRAFLAKEGLYGGGKPSKEKEEALVVQVLVPQIRAEAGKLAQLPDPSEDQALARQFVKGLEEVVALGEKDPSAMIGNASPLAKADAKARELGLGSCGET